MPQRDKARAIRTAIAFGAAIAAALGGCSGGAPGDAAQTAPAPSATFSVAPGEYAPAFHHAKETLRDAGFVLARVDARAGVITTAPRVSSGIATPWEGAEATLGDSIEAAANVERRVVEIRFMPAGAAPGGGEPRAPGWDAGALEGEVRTTVYRIRTPGRRVETASIRLTSYESDAGVAARGLEPEYVAYSRDDTAAAERVAALLRRPAGQRGR